MSHRRAMEAARAPHRSLAHGEHDCIALLERHDVRTRLHARPLLGQHQLAAAEIDIGPRQQYCDLQRKHLLAVQILVQAVVVALAITQQQRRGSMLARGAALGQELPVLGWERPWQSERFPPAIGDRAQLRIQPLAQLRDGIRQRIREVAVLAASVAMLLHDDAAAKTVAIVALRQGDAGIRIEQPRQHGPAARVEPLLEGLPVVTVDGRGRLHGAG
jgi:hypothetical protein